ncbi:glyoxalase [Altererythrobacter salegens]|uniref:Glyoxalase n=1 Tax=Croceibacterium salegens TaxID=1737568 RepID=A0A6I4SQP0_9SPHN|nr:VOC family protein [Croceibacterium salegens]MXO58173.1 glyoxalase [Croceibacterium salegens]
MAIVGLDHVQLAMPPGEEERARAFYVGVLEMAEIPKPPHLAVSGGCWFEQAGLHIHLGIEQDFRAAKKAHPALLVDDLPAFAEAVRAGGVDFTPGKPLEGYVRGDIVDPFGNRIEVMQKL